MLGWLTSMKLTITTHIIFLPSELKRTLGDNLQYFYKKKLKEGLSEYNTE